MSVAAHGGTDRFGNVLDPIVNYARGSILRGTDEEVARMLRARQLVAERVRATGADTVYDLSGMNRGGGISAEDTQHLTSHVPFFERFEGRTEPLALKHMGADASRHAALILNRVSAVNCIALTTLAQRGDKVYALAPKGGVTHPSCVRPLSIAGAEFHQFHSTEDLDRKWQADGPPRLLLITPISASKRHLDFSEFTRALGLPRGAHTLAYVDDAHMASRVSFFDEPRTFGVGNVDIAVCSADKHVAGPRAGVMVGRKDLIKTIGSLAYEFGLEAQAGQYVGVANALRNFDTRPVKEAGELAKQLLEVLRGQYGTRAYLGGPGVSIGGDDIIDIAREQRRPKDKPALVAVEAAGLVAMEMLEKDGVLTIGAVSMPGSAPVVRLMMYPDGAKLGIERIAASLENGISRLAQVLDDADTARTQLLG
ncbi:MAG: L-seryl-tRNA(Ser) seleniumtransferase [Betaproteobacteria bacterium]|nr:L-seryl-tRNA(Ser) seleniumtransferase [Betaproteobacteria bacterium]